MLFSTCSEKVLWVEVLEKGRRSSWRGEPLYTAGESGFAAMADVTRRVRHLEKSDEKNLGGGGRPTKKGSGKMDYHTTSLLLTEKRESLLRTPRGRAVPCS